MKLHGSDNRGGIAVKNVQRALAHISVYLSVFVPLASSIGGLDLCAKKKHNSCIFPTDALVAREEMMGEDNRVLVDAAARKTPRQCTT